MTTPLDKFNQNLADVKQLLEQEAVFIRKLCDKSECQHDQARVVMLQTIVANQNLINTSLLAAITNFAKAWEEAPEV